MADYTFTRSYMKGDTDSERMLELALAYVQHSTRVGPLAVKGKARTRSIARARFLSYCLLYRYYEWTLMDIGRALNRDHSTVSHGVREFETMLDIDDKTGHYWKDLFNGFAAYVTLHGWRYAVPQVNYE